MEYYVISYWKKKNSGFLCILQLRSYLIENIEFQAGEKVKHKPPPLPSPASLNVPSPMPSPGLSPRKPIFKKNIDDGMDK